MAERFSLTNVKPVTTPMDPGAQYSIDQCPATPNQVSRMHGVPYSEGIGSVLWLAVVSRPDVAFAVGILSQFVQNLGPTHWEVLKWLIVYLNSTKELWLTFGGQGKAPVEGYCNADWASQKHCHSISGYLFQYRYSKVTWSSKKQSIIVLLSTEAKYIAQTHAVKEALWL